MEVKIVRLDSAQSIIRASVSRALAEALITGIDNAKEEGHELTQLQQIDLAAMIIMSYEQALLSCKNLEVSSDFERMITVIRAGKKWVYRPNGKAIKWIRID